MLKRVLLTLLGSLLVANTFAAAKQHTLTQDELIKLFWDKTAFGLHIKKNLQISDYYGKKGKFVRLHSDGKRLLGKWWVSKKRDAVCIRYNHKKEKSYCRAVISDGKGGYNRIQFKGSNILIHYVRLEKGNTIREVKKAK